MPVFGLAALWNASSSPELAAALVEGLGALMPSAQSLQLVVALREEEVGLELKVEVPGYPRASVDRLAEEVRRSGGTFVELWRLPKQERDQFRATSVAGGTAYKHEEHAIAAKVLQEHLTTLSVRGPRTQGPPAAREAPATTPPLGTTTGEVPVTPAPTSAARSVAHAYRGTFAPIDGPQRRGRRFAVKLEMEFRTELDFVREHALNISNGGLFVRTAHRPPPDSVVTVDVKLPNGSRLQGDAVVVHVVDEPYKGGVGLAFLSDDPTFARTLDDYLASLVSGTGG